MAVYASPQPLWKRNLAGILDFLLAAFVFGTFLFYFFPDHHAVAHPQVIGGRTELGGIGLLPTLALIALIVAYFVVLGRTGEPWACAADCNCL
jgi:hypothetical protein